MEKIANKLHLDKVLAAITNEPISLHELAKTLNTKAHNLNVFLGELEYMGKISRYTKDGIICFKLLEKHNTINNFAREEYKPGPLPIRYEPRKEPNVSMVSKVKYSTTESILNSILGFIDFS